MQFTQRVNVGDIDLFIKVHNIAGDQIDPDQATLIFIHGGPGVDHTMHEKYWSQFAKIGVQVILPDTRGTGQSDYGEKDKWCLAQWAEDIHQLIQRLGLKKCFIGGISAGGYITYQYALKYSQEAAGIIICNAEPYNSLERILEGYRKNVINSGDDVDVNAILSAVKAMFTNTTQEVVDYFFQHCIQYAGFPNPPQEHVENCKQNPEMSKYFFQNEFFTFNLLEDLSKIDCPVLILASDGSPIHPIEASREAAEKIKPALLHYHEFLGAGAEVYSFHPKEICDIVKKFFKKYG